MTYQLDGLIPLLLTRNSSTISRLFQRYLSTLLNVIDWYENGDPFDPESRAYRSLKSVRTVHMKYSNYLNKEHKLLPYKMWINQKTLCMTQFSFIGLVAIFPEKV